jgi:hypothetical protein
MTPTVEHTSTRPLPTALDAYSAELLRARGYRDIVTIGSTADDRGVDIAAATRGDAERWQATTAIRQPGRTTVLCGERLFG